MQEKDKKGMVIMAMFKVRRVKANKRGYFVPASKRVEFITSLDPTLEEGMVCTLPGMGKDFFEILKDYGGGRSAGNSYRGRRNSGSGCMSPYWMEG